MKAILFDLDGTLIDSTEPILTGFKEAFKSFGRVAPSDEFIKELIGHPLDYMFDKLGIKKEQIDDFIEAYKNSYVKNYLDGTTLLPGCKSAIEAAYERGFVIASVTTKGHKTSEILLEHLGVGKYFTSIVGRDDVEHPKPHPEPILKALSTLNVNPEKSMMIGDTPMDANAAKSAGAMSFGVCCGYSKKSDLEGLCDKIFASTKEAVEFILRNY